MVRNDYESLIRGTVKTREEMKYSSENGLSMSRKEAEQLMPLGIGKTIVDIGSSESTNILHFHMTWRHLFRLFQKHLLLELSFHFFLTSDSRTAQHSLT